MMARSTAIFCIILWQTATITLITAGEGLRVKLREIVDNLDVATRTTTVVGDSGVEDICSSDWCSRGILASREGPLYFCVQPAEGGAVEDGLTEASTTVCSLTYRLHEESQSCSNDRMVALDSVFVAFAADSKRTLRVYLGDNVVVESWTAKEGTTAPQKIPGLEGYVAETLTIEAIMEGNEWIAITETEIYVDVDDVPVMGVSATDLVYVTAKATVKNEDVRRTLDGNTSKMRAWACTVGDVCEITYDLRGVQFIEQVRIAFVGKSSTRGSTVNVYTAGIDGNFSSVLTDVPAKVRGPSVRGDLQTYGGIRTWGRYLKIEGVVGTGGSLFITEVEIRIGKGCDQSRDSKPPSRRYPVFSLPDRIKSYDGVSTS